MSSPKIAFVVLLILGAIYAFNPADYVYRSEGMANITYKNFTDAGSMYSIVSINSNTTFLLKDGNLMNNQTEVSSILKSYYLKTYYPTDTEMSDLRALITRFNVSRNDGYDFKGKEEYTCRDDVLLSNGKISVTGKPIRCTDHDSCLKVAMLLFSVYGEGLNLGSASVIVGPLEDFTPSSIAMDNILANYSNDLDNLDETNVASTFAYIRDNADKLKNYSLKIESTIFRTPRLNDSVDRKACQLKCWAICPSMELDQAALDQIKAKSSALAQKVTPIGEYNTISLSILSNTNARLEYKESESTATDLIQSFAPLNRTGNITITLGETALKHVTNSTLRSKLNRLEALHASIPDGIAKRNFSTTGNDIAEYKSLIPVVNSSATDLILLYDEAKNAKNSADALIFVLETKDLDPSSQNKLEEITNITDNLDQSFKDGLSAGNLTALNSSYSQVVSQAQALMEGEKDVPASSAVLLFRGFARQVNNGIAGVATETKAIDAQTIPENPLPTLGLFSALVFLSFASLIIMAFLYLVSSTRRDSSRTRHVLAVAFVVAMVYLLGLSVFLYLFLNKTSSDANFSEYKTDLDSRNSTTIVLDLRNVSYGDAQLMQTCASRLSDTLAAENKTVKLYTLNSNNCNVSSGKNNTSTMGTDLCIADAQNASSAFMLGYSSQNKDPRFSIIYQNKAQINANADYYGSCPLVALFS